MVMRSASVPKVLVYMFWEKVDVYLFIFLTIKTCDTVYFCIVNSVYKWRPFRARGLACTWHRCQLTICGSSINTHDLYWGSESSVDGCNITSEMIHGSLLVYYGQKHMYIFVFYWQIKNKYYKYVYICISFFSFILCAFLSSSPKSLFPLLLLVPMHVTVLDLCETCLWILLLLCSF